MSRPVLITQEDNWFVAEDIPSGVASQGKTIQESLNNLKEALELYYEGTDKADETAIPPVFLTTMEV